MRRAFTLLEIVFVLILTAILASIGNDIIFQAYENYLLSQQLATSLSHTQVATEEIAKRLERRVRESAVSILDKDHPTTIEPLANHDQSHTIIAWIGRAYEARRGEYNGSVNYPGWSGFVDLKESNKSQLVTKGDDLRIATRIIEPIYETNLSQPNNGCAVIFQTWPGDEPHIAYGWLSILGTPPTHIFTVHAQNSHTLLYDSITPSRIWEHYYLACSAYAIVPETDAKGKTDLYLYYNFRPWMGESLNDAKKALLLQNVTIFDFKKTQRTIEIRLCANASLSSEINATLCSKKVIF